MAPRLAKYDRAGVSWKYTRIKGKEGAGNEKRGSMEKHARKRNNIQRVLTAKGYLRELD